MKEPLKRWYITYFRDLSWDPPVWVLGLYWRLHPNQRMGYRTHRCYVEFRVDTSNPFSLRYNLK